MVITMIQIKSVMRIVTTILIIVIMIKLITNIESKNS